MEITHSLRNKYFGKIFSMHLPMVKSYNILLNLGFSDRGLNITNKMLKKYKIK